MPVTPSLDRSRTRILDAAMSMLVRNPEWSLAELAGAIGIGRTTLHRMFASRELLMTALAHHALDNLEENYQSAGFGPGGAAPPDVLSAITALVQRLIPLGPSLMFLERVRELARDPDLRKRADALDRPLRAMLTRASAQGVLDPKLPDWWLAETLFANVWVAWEQIAAGRLASQDATALVVRTWFSGVQPQASP